MVVEFLFYVFVYLVLLYQIAFMDILILSGMSFNSKTVQLLAFILSIDFFNVALNCL